MTTKSRLAVHKVLLKSTIIVFNALLQTSSIQSIYDADHALLITSTTTPLNNVTAEFHVPFQGNSMPTTSANALLIKREPKEFGINQETHATVPPIFHFGTVSTVLLVQLVLNSIQRKNNVTTAPTDSSEISTVTLVFQDFDFRPIYFLYLIHFPFSNFILSHLSIKMNQAKLFSSPVLKEWAVMGIFYQSFKNLT
jgi:hypothetical protein